MPVAVRVDGYRGAAQRVSELIVLGRARWRERNCLAHVADRATRIARDVEQTADVGVGLHAARLERDCRVFNRGKDFGPWPEALLKNGGEGVYPYEVGMGVGSN